jgi:site-specific DNA recombinase
MRIAIYARVSTQRQADAQTIDQQLDRLLEHLKKDHHNVSQGDIFRDDGYSGSTLNRPGLDQLRDNIKAAHYDQVLITAPDRLARNYVHQMVLLEEFGRYGCEVQFLDRPISQDPHDQLLLQIRGAVAEYERILISERMRRGRQQKLRSGTLLPWSTPPYGYRVNPDRPRDPEGVYLDRVEAAVVKELFVAYADEAVSLGDLSRRLYTTGVVSATGKKRWQITTVRNLLTNPTYTGQIYTGRTHARAVQGRRSALLPVGHGSGQAAAPPEQWTPAASVPAIVSQAQYDAVQAKLAQNQAFARRNNKTHPYLLRALVSCGHCRLSCSGRTVTPGNYRYYCCHGKRARSQSARAEHCRARCLPAHALDQLVWQDLCDLINHPESIAHALERAHGGHWLPQELQARRETLRKAQASLENQLERLTQAYLVAVIPLAEYQRRRHEVEKKHHVLAQQAKQLEGQVDQQAALADMITSVEALCQRIQTGLNSATFEQKRTLVELLIDRVVVTDDEVDIHYVIPTNPSSEHIRFCHLRKDYCGSLQP